MRILFIAIILMWTSSLVAQSGLINTIEVNGIDHVAIDRAGDIYVLTSSTISKFDKDGKQIGEASITLATSFDTGNGVRLLMYNRENQEYTILTPSLTKVSENPIDNSLAIEPWLVCSSGDYNILILDAADWSIKKVDSRQSKILTEFKIDSSVSKPHHFLSIREYQNFIFLLDKQSGISIFNSIGLKLKTIKADGITSFQFLGQELYYFNNGKLYFTDLFTMETREEEVKGSYHSVLITDERLIAVKENMIQIFEYHP